MENRDQIKYEELNLNTREIQYEELNLDNKEIKYEELNLDNREIKYEKLNLDNRQIKYEDLDFDKREIKYEDLDLDNRETKYEELNLNNGDKEYEKLNLDNRDKAAVSNRVRRNKIKILGAVLGIILVIISIASVVFWLVDKDSEINEIIDTNTQQTFQESTYQDNSTQPTYQESTHQVTIFEVDERPQSCLEGAKSCHINANCVNFTEGFCCECAQPYYGNGYRCLEPGVPQRLNGKVSGILNGVPFDKLDMNVYVVTTDGRAYISISNVPAVIGPELSTMYTVGGIIGWMFALMSDHRASNGYMFTGEKFNMTSTVKYQSGEITTIQQQFFGHNALNDTHLETQISGTVPDSILNDVRITMDNFKEEYRRVSTGVIKSYSTRTYRKNDVAYKYSLEQTVSFNECERNQVTDIMRLSVTRIFAIYNDQQKIVRYASTNSIGVLNDDLASSDKQMTNVAFTKGQNRTESLEMGTPIFYSKDITAINAKFNSSRFICRVPGMYAFHFNTLAHNENINKLNIYHNDNYMASLVGYTNSNNSYAGNSVILFLSSGDSVYLKPNTNQKVFGADDQIYTTFTGALLTPGRTENGVGFSSGLNHNLYTSSGNIVKYNVVFTNTFNASGYNPNTGYFTASVEGTYVFHYHAVSIGNSRIWLELHRNDKYVNGAYGYTPYGHSVAGNTAILYIYAGDKVHIKTRDGKSVGIRGRESSITCSFSGALLFLKITTDQSETAFSASLVTHFTSNGHILKFDHLLSNLGDAYDVSTGIFTAKISGTYVFHFHAVSQSNRVIWLELHHNNKYVDSLYSYIPNTFSTGGNSAVLELFAGDQVYLHTPNKNSWFFGARGEIYCTFSGYFVASA